MPLLTRQTARRRKRKRRRLPSLASRAGTACWGLERRDCPCTVPPRVGQHQTVACGGQWESERPGLLLKPRTWVEARLAVCSLWALSTSFPCQREVQGLGRSPGQETLGPQQRRMVAVGPLRSGRGRMEMPYLGKGPWVPFPALLPNLTKVSEEPQLPHPHAALRQPCSSCLHLMLPTLPAARHPQEEVSAHHQREEQPSAGAPGAGHWVISGLLSQ